MCQSGIGGPGNALSCIYCTESLSERQHVCDPGAPLVDHFRGDLGQLFGIPMDRVHICSLHALTRVTEKLVKMLAARSYVNFLRAEKDVQDAKSKLRAVELAETARIRTAAPSPGKRPTGRAMASRSTQVRAAVTARDSAVEMRCACGNIDQLRAAMVECGIVSGDYKIEVTPRSADDCYSVKVSSLTGPQCRKLLKAGPNPRYVELIRAALGACVHTESR